MTDSRKNFFLVFAVRHPKAFAVFGVALIAASTAALVWEGAETAAAFFLTAMLYMLYLMNVEFTEFLLVFDEVSGQKGGRFEIKDVLYAFLTICLCAVGAFGFLVCGIEFMESVTSIMQKDST